MKLSRVVKARIKAAKAAVASYKDAFRSPTYDLECNVDSLPLSVSYEGEGLHFDEYDFEYQNICFNVGDKFWSSVYYSTTHDISREALNLIEGTCNGMNIKEAFDHVLGKSWRLPPYLRYSLQFYTLTQTEEGRDLLRSINIAYIDYVKTKKVLVKTLLELGVTHQQIFKAFNTSIADSVLLTKKKIIEYINNSLNMSLYMFSSAGQLRYRDIVPQVEGNVISEREVQTLDVWAWCQAHTTWTNKSKMVHGPGGRQYLLHNHQIIKSITNDMLVRGIKTSPSVIEECLEEKAKALIEEQAKNNKDLPLLPVTPTSPNIVQLRTSQDLIDEGKIMNHCVGGYIDACLIGISYIIHIDDDTEKGATAELCPKPWRVAQIFGEQNSLASLEAKGLVNNLVEELQEYEKNNG